MVQNVKGPKTTPKVSILVNSNFSETQGRNALRSKYLIKGMCYDVTTLKSFYSIYYIYILFIYFSRVLKLLKKV